MEKAIKRDKTIAKVSNASTATMIVGFGIGFGIGHLICEADKRLNDNKMALGMAKKFGVTEEISPAASASTLHFI